MAISEVGPLLSAIDHSTVLPPSEPLRRLLGSLDKHHLIHIVLSWIHGAQHSPSSKVLAPQLSRRASRKGGASRNVNFDDAPSQDQQRVSISSYLDLHEERRARSYVELTSLWLESMSEAKISRSRGVDRILNVDWPSGLTYAMVAILSFELIRASPVRRVWHTFRLDYGDEGDVNSKALLHRLTPAQFCQRFSAELRHYCSHAIFLDAAIQQTQQSASTALLDPLPDNWCQFFTHLRVVTNYTPTDVCSTGLHILHIPHTSWCLVSGTLGRTGSEVREMALTALANALGAKQVKTAQEALKGETTVVEMGAMTDLSGKDPLALRDVLLNAGLIGEEADGSEGQGKAVPGGKGRSMKRGEAEDGPLTRAEKRQREDPSGLYSELEQKQHSWQEQDYDEDDLRHPHLQQQSLKRKRRLESARTREVNEVFGKRRDLPRLERMRYHVRHCLAAQQYICLLSLPS
jgi:hypothetical protein